MDSSITNKIQKGDFCSDKYTNASKRIKTTSLTPIFTCPNNGNMLNLKVGLLTADELVYSGALRKQKGSNIQTYLNNNVRFWTMTNIAPAATLFWMPDLTYINNGNSISAFSGRAVINLKSDTLYTTGDGTKDNPYVIK